MILKLIINAFEAMSGINEGERELLISTGKAEEDGVFVSVRDSGSGGWSQRLFLSASSSPSIRPSRGGLGLGLSICPVDHRRAR